MVLIVQKVFKTKTARKRDYLQCILLLGCKRMSVQRMPHRIWVRKVNMAMVGRLAKNGQGVQLISDLWTHQLDSLCALHQAQQVVVWIIV